MNAVENAIFPSMSNAVREKYDIYKANFFLFLATKKK